MLDCLDDPAFVLDLFAFVVQHGLRVSKEHAGRSGHNCVGMRCSLGTESTTVVWPFEKQLVDGCTRSARVWTAHFGVDIVICSAVSQGLAVTTGPVRWRPSAGPSELGEIACCWQSQS